jgi:DNA polymerase-1
MAAERAAINMPIQGTAADIVKRAMLVLDERLRAQGSKARMLLQVHDELLFEAPEGEAESTAALAREVMSSVAELKVPLRVDVGIGHSWADAH